MKIFVRGCVWKGKQYNKNKKRVGKIFLLVYEWINVEVYIKAKKWVTRLIEKIQD